MMLAGAEKNTAWRGEIIGWTRSTSSTVDQPNYERRRTTMDKKEMVETKWYQYKHIHVCSLVAGLVLNLERMNRYALCPIKYAPCGLRLLLCVLLN